MTVRARRLGFLALTFLAGASLLGTSISLALEDRRFNRTLNFTVSQALAARGGNAGRHRDVWVVRGNSVKTWKDAAEALAVWRRSFPDGMPMLALAVQIGPHQPRPILTNALRVEDLLAALRVRLAKTDLIIPTESAILWPGMRLKVVRIRQIVQSRSESTPYETLIKYSKDMGAGQSKVVTAGRPGRAVRTYRVTYVNGTEVTRELLAERTTAEAIDEMIAQGTSPPGPHGYQIGQASWYDFCRKQGDYAAHLTLPFGTRVKVTNLDNGKTVTVVINDRGPYGVPGRIVDLCDSAFAQIAPLGQGVANVELTW
jgi:surface rod structure-forming protein G/rare lipoprotein A (RlpA)-like double-psi beta-barrel protein